MHSAAIAMGLADSFHLYVAEVLHVLTENASTFSRLGAKVHLQVLQVVTCRHARAPYCQITQLEFNLVVYSVADTNQAWCMSFRPDNERLPHVLQYSTVQYRTVQHSSAQHSTAQHSTAQHSTAQHSTAQHSTAQHSTVQNSTPNRHLVLGWHYMLQISWQKGWFEWSMAFCALVLRFSVDVFPHSGVCPSLKCFSRAR